MAIRSRRKILCKMIFLLFTCIGGTIRPVYAAAFPDKPDFSPWAFVSAAVSPVCLLLVEENQAEELLAVLALPESTERQEADSSQRADGDVVLAPSEPFEGTYAPPAQPEPEYVGREATLQAVDSEGAPIANGKITVNGISPEGKSVSVTPTMLLDLDGKLFSVDLFYGFQYTADILVLDAAWEILYEETVAFTLPAETETGDSPILITLRLSRPAPKSDPEDIADRREFTFVDQDGNPIKGLRISMRGPGWPYPGKIGETDENGMLIHANPRFWSNPGKYSIGCWNDRYDQVWWIDFTEEDLQGVYRRTFQVDLPEDEQETEPMPPADNPA